MGEGFGNDGGGRGCHMVSRANMKLGECRLESLQHYLG